MTEKRLFVKSDEHCTDRWLHKSEMFIKEKNWNYNLPSERQFKSGECIVTNKNDTAYSIDEIINLLNYFNRCTVSNNEFIELKDENKKLKSINKSQELEIVRLHRLADAMSGVLRELGIYDVYNNEQIENVKNIIEQGKKGLGKL